MENPMNFDARTAKSLPAGQSLTFPAYPGLRFAAGKKSRSWIYRYKSPIDDIMRQIKIGAWPAKSWEGAVVEWEKLRAIRQNDRDPALEQREQRTIKKQKEKQQAVETQAATYTLGMLIQDYLTGHVERNRQASSAKNMRHLLESIPADIAKLPAAGITRKQAFDLISARADTPVAAQTLRQELAAAWNYGLDAELLPETTPNWWQRVLKGKLKSQGRKINGKNIGAQKRVLSEAEIAKLMLWLPNFNSRKISDILTLYLWTGTRGGEIVAMEAKEITQENGQWWWTIPKHKTKNARHAGATDLRVPLFGRAERIVRQRLETNPTGFLFASKRTIKTGHFSQSSIGDAVNFHQPYCQKVPTQARPRLEVVYWAPHDLRRTTRTLLAAIGCPDAVAESILGHMQTGIIGIYNRYAYDKERVEWLRKLSEKLEQIIADESAAQSETVADFLLAA
jgi:integrase